MNCGQWMSLLSGRGHDDVSKPYLNIMNRLRIYETTSPASKLILVDLTSICDLARTLWCFDSSGEIFLRKLYITLATTNSYYLLHLSEYSNKLYFIQYFILHVYRGFLYISINEVFKVTKMHTTCKNTQSKVAVINTERVKRNCIYLSRETEWGLLFP